MSPPRPLARASTRELARASTTVVSPSTVRARVEVRDVDGDDDGRALTTTARFLWPIGEWDTVRDVRERVARVVRSLASGRCDDARDDDGSAARDVALDVDGYALLDECLARDVVRDDDVVRARPVRARGVATRATIGDVLKRPLAPPVSDDEGRGPRAGTGRGSRRSVGTAVRVEARGGRVISARKGERSIKR